MESKEKTYGSALNAMQRYCAKRETCIFDIKRKLNYYHLKEEDKTKVLAELIKEDFVNEERYAKIFMRDKFRLNKWGRIKISYQLRAKSISEKIINVALEEIIQEEYEEVLKEEIDKKKHGKSVKDKAKIIRFFQSRGFELDTIVKCINNQQANH